MVMKNRIFSTTKNYGALALRLILGTVLFSHGAQNMLGWFNGIGLKAMLIHLTSAMKLPWLVALLVICIQFFGSLMLLFGAATRVAALGVFGIFIGMATYHFQFGFYMNWAGTNSGEGFEYHALVLGMSFALVILGGGALSADRKFAD
jgi:putative oxidoreductase